jgi:hypothetical protein
MEKKFQTFKEFLASQGEPAPQPPAPNPHVQKSLPTVKKWKATKDEIIPYWKNLSNSTPILIKPVPYDHKGSTYNEDGLRITGSKEFIGSVLARLKEFLPFESATTSLQVVYRETQSPSQLRMGNKKTSYAFYIQVKERGSNAPGKSV